MPEGVGSHEVHRLDEIVIEDSRMQIPFSKRNRDIIILDSQVIHTLPVTSVSELLSFVPGVDIRQRGPWGAQADVSINGGTFDQTLILLNGVRVVDPQTGHNMMNLPVTPGMIQRIEILKGAAASAYGINAINGAINIITRLPVQNELEVSASAGSSFFRDTADNRLYGGFGAGISAALARKKVRHFLAANSHQSSGYRYNTSMKNHKIFYQNRLQTGDNSYLKLMAGYVSNAFGANGFYAAPGDKESEEKVQTAIAALQGSFRISRKWTIRPTASYRYNYDDYIYIRQRPSVYQNQHHTNAIDLSINNTVSLPTGILGLGLEYRGESILSNSLGHHHRDNYGFYSEYNFSTSAGLTIHGGCYLNYSSHFGLQFFPSVDVGYPLASAWRLFANIGSGMRVPTYTDWYYKGPQNIGNSQLVPEKSVHSEAGAKFSNAKVEASASFFYRYTDNFIDWVRNDVDDPWQPLNFKTIITPGISFNMDYDLLRNDGKVSSITAGLGYTHLAPYVSKKGNQNFNFSHYALENLKDQVVLRLHTQHQALTFGVTVKYEQRVNARGYFLTDFKAGAQRKKLSVSLMLNNATNVTYIETSAIPLPGRWMSVDFTWRM